MVLNEFQKLFRKQLYPFFQKLIEQGFVFVFFDEFLLQSQTKSHVIEIIEYLFQISQLKNLKSTPEKPCQLLLTKIFLGHRFIKRTLKPIPAKVEAIQKPKVPTKKREPMNFKGSLTFCLNFRKFLQISSETFF